ncbi:outer membrane protein [Novosphingobium sp. JCM 18896]|uniref:outer membrane protein n=1 Tax=Novosphingobium sp. JCM 18896 TaxID=2989731 RepID=UPI0022237785|nr:outer membrane beta-barrel protein [Novosphingobium sp. JCM 18896]MCW1429934.1 outer membrane beta-barrel protein [Novosphingobium sp. JCM 18896]
MNLYRSASLAALVVAAAVASPAWAQDARDTHFDGPYISGFVGLAAQGNDRADTLVFDTNRDGSFDNTVNTAAGANAFTSFCGGAAGGATPAAGCGGDRDRIEYGGRIGYDKRLGGGNFVLGGLLEVSKNNSRDFTSGYSSTPASYTVGRKLDHTIAARLRAGYTPGGGALFYATGGASWAKIDHAFATTNTANSFTEVDNGKRVWGWQAGGGAEIMVTNNVSLGLEYLYNRHRDNKYYVAVGQGTAPATNPFLLNGGGTNLRPSDTNFDYHSLRASLSFQF